MGGFRQHVSRELDPQLHSHGVIANRVLSPDGRWLALDARALMKDQTVSSSLYHAGLRAELTARLGVGWQDPVNGIAEMHGVDEIVLQEFSQRSLQVAARTNVKLNRFRETLGREPTGRERWRLEREAVTSLRIRRLGVASFRVRGYPVGRGNAPSPVDAVTSRPLALRSPGPLRLSPADLVVAPPSPNASNPSPITTAPSHPHPPTAVGVSGRSAARKSQPGPGAPRALLACGGARVLTSPVPRRLLSQAPRVRRRPLRRGWDTEGCQGR